VTIFEQPPQIRTIHSLIYLLNLFEVPLIPDYVTNNISLGMFKAMGYRIFVEYKGKKIIMRKWQGES
jgi:hypothetical protein